MKILVRALLGVLLSLVACNPIVSYHPPSETQPIQGQLLIWHPFEDTNAKIFKEALAEYEQAHADVHIVSEYIPQTELSTRFIQQFQSGLRPDLMVNFSTEIPALIRAGTLQELDPTLLSIASYTPQVLPQIRYRNNFYGIPLNSQIEVLCYNRTLVERSPHSNNSGSVDRSAQAEQDVPADSDLTTPPTTLDGLIQRAHAGSSVGIVSTFIDTFWGIQIFGSERMMRIIPSLS